MQIEQWDKGKLGRLTKDKKPRKHRVDCFEAFYEETHDWPQLNGVMAFDGATVRDTSCACFTFEHPSR